MCFDVSSPWRSVAAAQGGCITRRQLLGAGTNDAWVSRAVGRGTLVRVAPGVFRLPDVAPTGRAAVFAAVAATGPYAFAFRRTAAALWALDSLARPDSLATPDALARPDSLARPDALARPDSLESGDRSVPIEVGVARGRHVRAGAVARRLATLQPGDITSLGGIRVSSPGRTLFDLASLLDPDELEVAVESALRLDLVTEPALRSLPIPPANAGGPTWRAVLERRPRNAPPTGSALETRFVQLCRRCGIPAPERQFAHSSASRRYFLDFAWPQSRTAVEIDGRAVHGPDALVADLRRQNAIVLGGWLILRYTFEDIVLGPERTVAEVGRALAQAPWRMAN